MPPRRSPDDTRPGKKKRAKPSETIDAEVVTKTDTPADEGEPEADDEVEPDVAELGEEDPGVDLPVVGFEAEPAEPAPEKGLSRRDPFQIYINEIRKIPLLSREEEHELAAEFVRTQDPDIARRLVTANLRLVVKIAHEYRRAYRNLLDLVQEGNVGLMQAVKKYDPFRGVKLSSYAAWWIRAYILKFILNNWRLVKIGTTQAQRKLFFNLRKEKEKLEQLGFAPEHKLLAQRLDVTEAEVAEMEKRLEGSDLSLDAPIGRDDDATRTRLDTIPSTMSRPDVAAEAGEFRTILREKLEIFAQGLEGREQTLFRDRWLTDSPRTLQEIGDQFSISRERARQLEKRLLDRLRKYLEAELGTAVDIGAMSTDE
jgi:RNA polymerase sigma-32 factor